MRTAFLGTPAAAIPSLAALVQLSDLQLVVTQPDRPKRRSGTPTPPPVKEASVEWGIPVVQPESHADLHDALSGLDLDVAVVVAYGRILKPDALSLPRVGFVNVHFSLLPRWRGAAPVEHAIAAGDDVTGVSLMLIDEGLDTGPVIAVKETAIDDDETGGSLTARLADLGALIVSEVLADFALGNRVPAPQLAAGVMHAPQLSPGDARLDPGLHSTDLERRVRAFHPRPGAWVSIDGVRTKVSAAWPSSVEVEQGVVATIDGRPHLGCDVSTLELLRLQPAGKRVLTGEEWSNGRRAAPAVVDSA